MSSAAVEYENSRNPFPFMSNIAEGFESRTQDPRLPGGGDGPAGQHRELRADRAPPAGQHQKEIERFEPRGGVGG